MCNSSDDPAVIEAQARSFVDDIVAINAEHGVPTAIEFYEDAVAETVAIIVELRRAHERHERLQQRLDTGSGDRRRLRS